MFGTLKHLTQAAVGLVVETPVALAADVVTLGGALNNTKQPYTTAALEKVVKNIQKSTK